MHVTKFTDYSLRTLMFLALQKDDRLVNIADISETFEISRNHIMKVVSRLASNGLVTATRGRSGGVKLGMAASDINIGAVVRQLETMDRIADCENGPCLFIGHCRLDSAFQKASTAFLAELDQYTLADLVTPRAPLHNIIQMRSQANTTATTASAATARRRPKRQQQS